MPSTRHWSRRLRAAVLPGAVFIAGLWITIGCWHLASADAIEKHRARHQRLGLARPDGRLEDQLRANPLQVWLGGAFVGGCLSGLVLLLRRGDAAITAEAGRAMRDIQTMRSLRDRIVEMFADGQDAEQVLLSLARGAEARWPGACVAILALNEGRFCCTGPSLPATLVGALQARGMRLAAAFGPAGGDGVKVHDLTEGAWAEAADAARAAGLPCCWSMPIRVRNHECQGFVLTWMPTAAAPTELQRLDLGVLAGLAAMVLERRQMAEAVAYRALHDPLTGLLNRAMFMEELRRVLGQAQRNGRSVGVLSVDVDRFRMVNDAMGPAAGDELLRKVAERLAEQLRQSDVLARTGGDDFAIALGDMEHADEAARAAGRLLDLVRRPIEVGGRQLFISLSIGISVSPEDGTDADALLRNADTALARARRNGRGGFECYTAETDALVRARLETEGQLRQALEQGELMLHYQPQVDLEGTVVAVEALVRWRHPTRGMVSPAEFIPLAEETGLIVPIGAWVLCEACGQARAWREAGVAPLKMAVNVAPRQFASAAFVPTVKRILQETGMEAGGLELEVTEGLLMDEGAEVAEKLAELRALGVGVALDDFGTGYSSLSRLNEFPIQTLKIDRAFVSRITPERDGERSGAMIEAIVDMGRSLGLAVVAEGVETDHQRRFLEKIGCTLLQGYLFGRPKSADELEAELPRVPVFPAALSA